MASNILREIIKTVGLPAAIVLTRVYGGRTLRVPMKVNAVHPLTVAIGATAAGYLCAEFGGLELDIPSERTALLEQRNSLIVQQFREGSSIKGLSRRYGLSRTMVRKVLRGRNIEVNSSTA
jgi:hypothetical protein